MQCSIYFLSHNAPVILMTLLRALSTTMGWNLGSPQHYHSLPYLLSQDLFLSLNLEATDQIDWLSSEFQNSAHP